VHTVIFSGRLRLALLALIGALALLAASGPSIDAQSGSLTGTFHVDHGDPPLGSNKPPITSFVITDDSGRVTPLDLDESVLARAGGRRALEGNRVTVTLGPGSASGGRVAPVRSIRAEGGSAGPSIQTLNPGAPDVTGTKRFAVILCRFANGTGNASFERDPSFYQGLLGFNGSGPSAYPSLNHYWATLSQDRFVNLLGSHVYGWFDIAGTLADYNNESTSEDLGEAARDCAGAAQSSVIFNNYTHLGLVFNGFIHGASWGGSRTLTLDGQTKNWKVAWMTGDMHHNQRVWVHEMGHLFGLPHSSGPYDETYDSQWDPMSRGPCGNTQAVYGCIASYLTSAHLDFLGWIPNTGAKFTAAPGQTARVTLQPLREPYASGSVRRLMAQIPIGSSATKFYTVEYRSSGGYDDGTPRSGVVIHKVDTAPDDRNARVVDADNNGDPNDDGAVWKAGETFVDAANNIAVHVESIFGGTAEIVINPRPNVTITDVTLTEAPGLPGPTSVDATFKVTLSHPHPSVVKVNYATANSTATAPADYTSRSGTLTFNPGETSKTVTVPVKADEALESTEVFFVNLSSPVNGVIADGQGKGTILDYRGGPPPPTCPPQAPDCVPE
jgi:M6 family metalloprotease-like protein